MILRRRIHITKLNVSIVEPEGLYMLTITIHETSESTRKLILQLDKQVEVFKTFYDTDQVLVQKQVAQYRATVADREEPEASTIEMLHSAAI